MNLEEFKNSQYKDESKIKCDKCKINNKLNLFNDKFYRCNICKKNTMNYELKKLM